MKIYLKKLCPSDGDDIYEMLREFPENENGFITPVLASIDAYKPRLADNAASDNQTGLADGWRVPQTIYWLFIDGKPAGCGKIHHILTDKLLADGGTIGYPIRPDQRNKGFGEIPLSELTKECSDMGIEKVLLTIHKNNTASIKTALDNHGVIEKSSDTLCYIWIRCC